MAIRTLLVQPLHLAVLATALAVAPASAKPPWISVEYPANPFVAGARGALLTIHAYRHAAPTSFSVRVVAEGTVNGKRQHVQLTARPTSSPGVYLVMGPLPRGEAWVVQATITGSTAADQATVLASLTSDARLAAVEVPHSLRDGYMIPRAATQADVDAALATALAASRSRPVALGGGNPLLAGAGLLLLLPALLARRSGRRGRRPVA